MRENCDFVLPVNILTTFACAPFSWATQHTTVCLDTIQVHALAATIVATIPQHMALKLPIGYTISYINYKKNQKTWMQAYIFHIC